MNFVFGPDAPKSEIVFTTWPLLAPDVTFGNAELAGSVGEFTLQLQWERVMGWQFVDPTCTAGTSDRVVCSYAIQDAVNQEAGQGPFPGNSFLLELSDGLIHRSSHNFNAEEFFTLSEGAFIGWARLNHPKDLAVMLDDRPFPFAPRPPLPHYTLPFSILICFFM